MATHLKTPFRDHLNWLMLALFALAPGNYLELVGVGACLKWFPYQILGVTYGLESGLWKF